ncbi:MAG: hypothetical protein RML56_12945 [Burkholderiales bacterium]|nr:hypothetical protein [Burkholderiales bacterium]
MAAAATAAAQTELKFSTYVPPTHGFVVDVLEPLGKEIEKLSGGKATVRVFAGNSPFGKVENQADQVKQGVVDLGFGLNGIPGGRYLRTSIMELPFVAESAESASKALWAMLPGALAEDWKEFKVVALHCHNPGLFHTRAKPLKTLEDVKGLRMRAPEPADAGAAFAPRGDAGRHAAGTGIENLEKGVIDGAVFPWDAIRGFRLEGLLKHHLDARIYTACFHLVMEPGAIPGARAGSPEGDRCGHRPGARRQVRRLVEPLGPGRARRGEAARQPDRHDLARAARAVARAAETGDRRRAREAGKGGRRERARDLRRDGEDGRALRPLERRG